MKKTTIIAIIFCAVFGIANAQNSYWVFFTDKRNTTFDPYQYFDAKTIERYAFNGADLYDVTNYPVNGEYVARVETACEELIGTSRWLNAAGVMATEEQIAVIQQFPFVAYIQLIASDMEIAESNIAQKIEGGDIVPQIRIQQGELFKQHNITGKGVRIAVFDGGFKGVEAHPAFRHLHNNHQIVKTWNFVKKKENVYEGHYHGRMVLSCIAGIMNDTTMLGMAPDAQFLLARTEVASEPKKEEVWWVQALEWADQNGADIVNSSLGYGKQRYKLKNMNGSSMVAKAANTAARKGMLVCNSMGNEGDDNEWKMLITPADADSILSVGAVSSLNQLASFSSFGPTADGRMKPNVVAYGDNNYVAGEKGNFVNASGTSFSSPMVAGFAACVKQLHPEYTAWQLKTEIEKSANHYPYFDYAFGYGVPQAGYFFSEKHESKEKNVAFKEDDYKIYLVPANNEIEPPTVFYKVTNGDGTIGEYNMAVMGKNYSNGEISPFCFYKNNLLNGQKLEMWCDGQYFAYNSKFSDKSAKNGFSDSLLAAKSVPATYHSEITIPDFNIYTRPFKSVYLFQFVLNTSFMLPSMWSGTDNAWSSDRLSHSLTFAFDHNWKVVRPYGIGFRIGFGSSWYGTNKIMVPENHVNMPFPENAEVVKNNIKITKFDLELYQRFFLGSAGNNFWFLDTGIFGEWNVGRRYKCAVKYVDEKRQTYIQRKYLPEGLGINKLDYGVRLRVGITRWFAIYGQYRISNLLKVKGTELHDFPKWEIGVQIF